MKLEEIERAADDQQLVVIGAFHPGPGDGAPEGVSTLLLLGPREPGFWPYFTTQSEYLDGAPNPLDRWSKRVIAVLADDAGGHAIFPSDGPPYPPFQTWAVSSGRAWVSPVTLLVHERAGLMLSYRGAIALSERLVLPVPAGQ
ncbi:MAG: ferredoxin, partial [Halocynthiibacter sp.]